MKALALVLLAACRAGSGAPDAAPATANDGFIWLESGSSGGNVDASFSTGHKNCTSLGSSGPCQEVQCPTTTAPFHSAGTIVVDGAAVPVTLMPDATNGYPGLGTDQALFQGGETLTVTARGAEVPAFIKSIIAPASATVTSPPRPSAASPLVTITASSPLGVSWTGGSGMMLVSITGGPSEVITVTCKFDASAGTGIVPAAALSVLPTGTGGSFAMAAITESAVTAGDWGVTIQGYHDAVWADGTPVSEGTLLQ